MSLAEAKAGLRKKEMEFNVMKLEVRLLEIEEEKIKIQESIENIKKQLKEE